MRAFLSFLHKRADNVAVGLLTAIFLSFILQIFTRYVLRQPLGWTLEACLMGWLWLVFWSGAFTLRECDHVRFTVLSDSVRPGVKRVFQAIAAIAIIAAFGVALAPSADFIAFMAIESSSLLKVRFDIVFSVFLIFSAGIIARYGWRLFNVLRGRQAGDGS